MTEFTIVVIGGASVGKTSVTVSLTTGKFTEEYNPTIEDQYQKELKIEDQKYILSILDTAGQEEYSVLRDQYWRQGDGFLLIYDITNPNSFAEVNNFYETIRKALESDHFPVVLCGNKCDLDNSRKVSKDDGKRYATSKDWEFFETSAKTRTNVDQAFIELVKSIQRAKSKSKLTKTDSMTSDPKKKKGFFSWFK